MNLIFDCERMKYPYIGLFEYCKQLGKFLQLHLSENDNITYYVPDEYQSYFGNFDCLPVKNIHKILPVKINRPAVWHTAYQLSGYIKNGGRNIKKVLTVHDLNFLYEKSSPAKIKKYLKAMQANIDRVDYIVAISEFTKSNILDNLKVNVPVSVIYNGCNVAEFPDYDSPGYRPAKPFLFALGTVLPKKNFHVLPCLLQNNDYELIISGKGDDGYAKKIVEEAKKYGVEKRIKLTGAVSVEDKYRYLKNCTAFLFPSLAEGFGIPPIEAMHFGKPVFLSTKTSLPEIGGRQAYYFNDFEPENMQAVFEKGMNHYVQTAPEALIKEHAAKFNWKQSAGEYYKIYQSI